MADIFIGTVSTNTTVGSVVEVMIADMVCTIKIVTNMFGDQLPIILKPSNVENQQIFYHIELLATLVKKDGTVAPAHPLSITSSRSRKEAWYEARFKVTGYNVCLEDHFDGELVEGNGLDEKHKRDFLFSVAGIPMQGTGKASNGKLIGLKAMKGKWHRNAKGNRDYAEGEDDVELLYQSGYGGKWKSAQVEHSLAVDPRKIPPLSKLNIESVGNRSADDTGSMIVGYHIDNFLGAGKEVVTTWLKSGLSGTERRVKFLGYK